MAAEYYIGVTYDGSAKLPIVIFSDVGGIDIETVAETQPGPGRQAPTSLR